MNKLLNGDQAIAYAALHEKIHLGTGYPGTPTTGILETLNELGGQAQWSPNEKVALEVALGVAYAGGKSLVTMKHVGVNVAADPLFSAAYTDLDGALVLVSGDDPGLSSSQNEQDNRHYARAAGLPMFEPADSQQAYDYTRYAFRLSKQFQIPVILRMTMRVCHTKSSVSFDEESVNTTIPNFRKDIPARVMLGDFAKTGHRKLRDKLTQIQDWNEQQGPRETQVRYSDTGIISTGISYLYAQEAYPDVEHFNFGLTYPLPIKAIKNFSKRVNTLYVIEEGDPILANELRAHGIQAQSKSEAYRFNELTPDRVKEIVENKQSSITKTPTIKKPELCSRCTYKNVFDILKDMHLIVAGDIGCSTLASLEPYQVIDSTLCMGASIGIGLGLRHTLPEQEAKRVISVIGDSTFIHSGITGLIEAVYNTPPTGHIILLLDNGTTAMTGHQPHPGTGNRLNKLDSKPANYKAISEAIGANVIEIDNSNNLQSLITDAQNTNQVTLIIAHEPCALKQWMKK